MIRKRGDSCLKADYCLFCEYASFTISQRPIALGIYRRDRPLQVDSFPSTLPFGFVWVFSDVDSGEVARSKIDVRVDGPVHDNLKQHRFEFHHLPNFDPSDHSYVLAVSFPLTVVGNGEVVLTASLGEEIFSENIGVQEVQNG